MSVSQHKDIAEKGARSGVNRAIVCNTYVVTLPFYSAL